MLGTSFLLTASALIAVTSALQNESLHLPNLLNDSRFPEDPKTSTLALPMEYDDGNSTKEYLIDETEVSLPGAAESSGPGNWTLLGTVVDLGEMEDSFAGAGNQSTTAYPTSSSSNASDREATERALRDRFQSIWPTHLWKAHGIYTDEDLLLINPHWLQFPPPKPISHYVLAALYTVLMTVGVSGNFLVIFMFCRCKSLRTPANILVMNLAVSDSLMMLKMPVFIYNCIYLGPALGTLGCQVYGFLGGLTGTTSIATLAAIALDRYFVVLYPLEPLKVPTRARARVCVLLAWTYGAIFSSMPLLGLNRYVPEGYLTSCSFDYLTDDKNSRTFIIVFFTAAWVMPFALISFCYASICRAVALAATYSSPTPVRKFSNQNNASSYHEQQRRRTEIRLAIVVLIVVTLWFVSWTPYATVALLGFSGNRQLVTPLVSMIPALFCKMASCIDPFVYAITHPRFRKEFARKFLCCMGAAASRKVLVENNGREVGLKRKEMSRRDECKDEKGEGVSVSEEEEVMVDMRESSVADNSEATSMSGERRNGNWSSDRPWTTDGCLYRSFSDLRISHPFGSWILTNKNHAEQKHAESIGCEGISLQTRNSPAPNDIILRSDFEPTTV